MSEKLGQFEGWTLRYSGYTARDGHFGFAMSSGYLWSKRLYARGCKSKAELRERLESLVKQYEASGEKYKG